MCQTYSRFDTKIQRLSLNEFHEYVVTGFTTLRIHIVPQHNVGRTGYHADCGESIGASALPAPSADDGARMTINSLPVSCLY